MYISESLSPLFVFAFYSKYSIYFLIIKLNLKKRTSDLGYPVTNSNIVFYTLTLPPSNNIFANVRKFISRSLSKLVLFSLKTIRIILVAPNLSNLFYKVSFLSSAAPSIILRRVCNNVMIVTLLSGSSTAYCMKLINFFKI
jgi:hypothetical protein